MANRTGARAGLLSASLLALLAGCSFAPEYKTPETTVPQAYGPQATLTYDGKTGQLSTREVQADDLRVSETVTADTPWQEFFKDKQLKQLIEMALQDNRNLQQAVARMEQARAQWGVDRASLFPKLGATVSGNRQRGPNPTGMGGTTISSQYMAGVALTSFELDLFGRLRNLSEAAYQQYLASAAGTRNVQIALIAETATQYYNERMATALLDMTRLTYEARKKMYDLVNARYRSGVASEIDVVQSKGLVDAAASQLAQLMRERAQARNALAILLGQPLPADIDQWPPLTLQAQADRIPAGLPSDLLLRRPDILAAENTLRAAGADIGAARAAFLPNISLTGTLGAVSSTLGDLFSAGLLGWTLAPGLTQPLFAGGSLVAGLDMAKASHREAVAAYQATVEQAFREVSDALAGEATLQAQWDALDARTASAQRYVNLSQARFLNGIDSFLTVQTAQVDLYDAQTQQMQMTFELLANRVNLYKALGGGWDERIPGADRPQVMSSQQEATPVHTAALNEGDTSND